MSEMIVPSLPSNRGYCSVCQDAIGEVFATGKSFAKGFKASFDFIEAIPLHVTAIALPLIVALGNAKAPPLFTGLFFQNVALHTFFIPFAEGVFFVGVMQPLIKKVAEAVIPVLLETDPNETKRLAMIVSKLATWVLFGAEQIAKFALMGVSLPISLCIGIVHAITISFIISERQDTDVAGEVGSYMGLTFNIHSFAMIVIGGPLTVAHLFT
jgi:hypothetical protein